MKLDVLFVCLANVREFRAEGLDSSVVSRGWMVASIGRTAAGCVRPLSKGATIRLSHCCMGCAACTFRCTLFTLRGARFAICHFHKSVSQNKSRIQTSMQLFCASKSSPTSLIVCIARKQDYINLSEELVFDDGEDQCTLHCPYLSTTSHRCHDIEQRLN